MKSRYASSFLHRDLSLFNLIRDAIMKPLFLLTCLVCFNTTVFGQEMGSLEGRLIDRDTKQEIIGAKIEVLGTTLGTVSDYNGQFRLEGLPIGTYRLKVTAPEYKMVIRSDVRVGSSQ
ncbi:MAG: carboxypeptidase-like regulatory domain-containing protein, partial [Leptonema sp. (in: bacteria)]